MYRKFHECSTFSLVSEQETIKHEQILLRGNYSLKLSSKCSMFLRLSKYGKMTCSMFIFSLVLLQIVLMLENKKGRLQINKALQETV